MLCNTNVRDGKCRVVSRDILNESNQHENTHADGLIVL